MSTHHDFMKMAIEEALAAKDEGEVPIGAVLVNAGDWRLAGSTLYVTLEPCAMCSGAIVLARLGTVVYGASDPQAGAGGSAYNILEDGRLGHSVDVIAGILEDECRLLLKGFFDHLR